MHNSLSTILNDSYYVNIDAPSVFQETLLKTQDSHGENARVSAIFTNSQTGETEASAFGSIKISMLKESF